MFDVILFFFLRVSSCSSTISNNCTYIQNPSYPSSYTTSGSCDYNVTPLSSDICQLRLDFDTFDITETSPGDGTCVDSFLVTSGSSRTYPTLCGTLTGQHSKLDAKVVKARNSNLLVLSLLSLHWTIQQLD